MPWNEETFASLATNNLDPDQARQYLDLFRIMRGSRKLCQFVCFFRHQRISRAFKGGIQTPVSPSPLWIRTYGIKLFHYDSIPDRRFTHIMFITNETHETRHSLIKNSYEMINYVRLAHVTYTRGLWKRITIFLHFSRKPYNAIEK